jgi:hypothetical protein
MGLGPQAALELNRFRVKSRLPNLTTGLSRCKVVRTNTNGRGHILLLAHQEQDIGQGIYSLNLRQGKITFPQLRPIIALLHLHRRRQAPFVCRRLVRYLAWRQAGCRKPDPSLDPVVPAHYSPRAHRESTSCGWRCCRFWLLWSRAQEHRLPWERSQHRRSWLAMRHSPWRCHSLHSWRG